MSVVYVATKEHGDLGPRGCPGLAQALTFSLSGELALSHAWQHLPRQHSGADPCGGAWVSQPEGVSGGGPTPTGYGMGTEVILLHPTLSTYGFELGRANPAPHQLQLRRAGPVPHLRSRAELTLTVGAQVHQLLGWKLGIAGPATCLA